MATDRLHSKKVTDLQTELHNSVLQFMTSHDIVEFRNPFRIYIEEMTFDNYYIRVPITARYLYKDGTVGTDDGEFILKELTIYEIAYILDILELGFFKTDVIQVV